MSNALLGSLYMNGVKVLGLLFLTLYLAMACAGESPMAVPTAPPQPWGYGSGNRGLNAAYGYAYRYTGHWHCGRG